MIAASQQRPRPPSPLSSPLKQASTLSLQRRICDSKTRRYAVQKQPLNHRWCGFHFWRSDTAEATGHQNLACFYTRLIVLFLAPKWNKVRLSGAGPPSA
mmetsp:Transcript_35223/g.74363  ORF Transcript_35223/g.74363 Transcript_35223/m.74363 type:complete len:99 (+) Transcript_35223:131-427(+)